MILYHAIKKKKQIGDVSDRCRKGSKQLTKACSDTGIIVIGRYHIYYFNVNELGV